MHYINDVSISDPPSNDDSRTTGCATEQHISGATPEKVPLKLRDRPTNPNVWITEGVLRFKNRVVVNSNYKVIDLGQFVP